MAHSSSWLDSQLLPGAFSQHFLSALCPWAWVCLAVSSHLWTHTGSSPFLRGLLSASPGWLLQVLPTSFLLGGLSGPTGPSFSSLCFLWAHSCLCIPYLDLRTVGDVVMVGEVVTNPGSTVSLAGNVAEFQHPQQVSLTCLYLVS